MTNRELDKFLEDTSNLEMRLNRVGGELLLAGKICFGVFGKENIYFLENEAKEIEIWNATHDRIHKISKITRPTASRVTAMTTSGESNLFAAAFEDNSIEIWANQTESKLFEQISTIAKADQDWISALAITRSAINKKDNDGQFFASGSRDGTIAVWDLKNGELSHKFEYAHIGMIWSLLFTHSNLLISGAADRAIQIWDMEKNKLFKRIQDAHEDDVTSLTLSDEDKFLISGSLDKSIAIWDLRQLPSSEDGSTKTESESLSGRITDAHSSGVSCVAVTTDSEYIISGSFDNSVKIWSNKNGSRTCTSQMLFDTAVTSLGMSREQNIILAGSQNRTVKVWERSKEKELLKFEHATVSTGALKYAKDQKFFITKACGNFVTILRTDERLVTERIDLGDYGYTDIAGEDIDITSDGKLLIIPSLTGKSITVLDLQEKKVSHHFESTHSDSILWIRVSPDNKYFISYSEDRSLAVWDLSNRKLYHRWENAHNGSRLLSAVISEKENHLFTGAENNSIVVWDFHQLEQLHVFDNAHGDTRSHRVEGLAITKDDLHLASSGKQEIVIWDLSANTKYKTYPKEYGSSRSLAFSSDMKLLAFLNADWSGGLRIASFEAGIVGESKITIIDDIHPPNSEIDSLCFIPGTCLLISSAQGEISICDTKKEIFIDRLNTKQVQSPSRMIPFGDASSNQILYVQGNKVLSMDVRTKKISIIFDNVNHVPITSLAASNDRSMIAFHCWKSIIAVNVETKAKSFQIDDLHERKPPPFLVFTNDAQHLISCGPLLGAPNFIVVCCLKTGQILFKFRGDGPVKVFPGDKKLVSLSGVLSIDGNFIHTFPKVHTGWVYCSALSEDGRIWVTGAVDRTIAVWDLKTMSLMKRIIDPRITEVFGSIYITRDGKYVFADSGGSIALYDLQTLTLVFVKKIEDSKISMVSTDRYVVTSSHYGLFSIWDTHSRNELTSITQSSSPVTPHSVAGLSPDGRYLILSHAEGYEVLYSQTNNKDHVPLYSISVKPSRGTAVWITQKNEMIFGSFSTLTSKPQLTFWDLEDRREIKAYEQKDGPVSWQVTCDGRYLVASFWDLTISVWNLRDTKIYVQIDNAHKNMGIDGFFPINLTSNSTYIISGAGDLSIAVWAFGEESHSLLVHRFENAHTSTVTSLKSTKDSKFLVSGSYDSTIAIWNLEDYSLTHRFINIENNLVWWLRLTLDDRFIIAAYLSDKIAIFDLRNFTLITRFQNFGDRPWSGEYHQESTTLFLIQQQKRLLSRRTTRALLPDSITFLPTVQAALQKCRSSDSTTKQELVDEIHISILSGIYLMKKRWNFLNLVIFLLPNVSPHTLLHLAIKNKIYLSLDYQNKTQLDYLLDYEGQKTVEVHQFSAYFFKNLSSFINLKGLYKDELLIHLSQLTQQIFETQSQNSFLRFFNNFVFDPADILNNYSKLPIQGAIRNDEPKAYIPLPELSINCDEYKSEISLEGTTTLKFHLLAFPLSCDITADDTLMLLQIFNSYEVEDTQFFDNLVIQDLLDFYWKISKKVLWLNVCFFIIPTILFTVFASIYPNPGNTEAVNVLLILSDIINCAVLVFEFAQASASIKDFIHDPWNFIEVTTATLPIVSSILYWANGPAQVLSFFTALSILFLYTKILITLRVIDQLRQLIRMILEILTDSMSFMTVVLVYTLAFTLLIYQIRLVDGEGPDFPSVLLEIYTLVIGSWDDTLYPGIAMPFFLFGTFLCTLVLLNMLIALMGSTYGRVMDNQTGYDNRERIAMMYEICSISNELKKVFRFCFCRRKIDKEAKRNTSFLLVAREFEPIVDDDEPTLQSTTEKLSKKMETEIRSIHDQMKNEGESMMNYIRTEFDSLRNAIAQMQTDVIKDKVHSSI